MSVRRIFVEKRSGFDVPAQQLLDDLRETFGVNGLRLFQRYDIEGLDDDEFAAVKHIVFSEPNVDRLTEELPTLNGAKLIAIEYLPGQFDQRADSAAQCCQLITGRERPLIRSARIVALLDFDGELEPIKHYLINAIESREASTDLPDTLQLKSEPPADVEILSAFNALDRDELKKFLLEKGFAMSVEDLAFCQKYFRDEERRPPTITELRVIDTYWSDHCRHTTFNTAIDEINFETDEHFDQFYLPPLLNAYKLYLNERQKIYGTDKRDVTLMDIGTIAAKSLKYDGLLTALDKSEEINACSIVVQAEVDGRVEDWLVMFKNETHNHPTEIEPFGGAATCLGGAIRDPLSGRSYVYQAMRITGASDPRRPLRETLKGKLPQRKITREAARGFSSYGNQIGLATGIVHEFYHEGYTAKRMEIGAVIAAAPKANVIRQRPKAGDAVLLVGGRTGRDGIGGATGSSKEHTLDSLETCGAEVQKGNPPTERKIQRLFRNPAVARLIKRCNDFGAGGVSVAIGELATGLDIELDAVRKKYDGLDGTELAISESQERMAVVVDAGDVEKFIELADAENLEAYRTATVTDSERLIMRWRGKKIVDIGRGFFDTNGVKQHVKALIQIPARFRPLRSTVDVKHEWLNNLGDLNVCSLKGLSERFDSTIGAASVLMPFGGRNQLTPAEGMAAKLPVNGKTNTATAMTFGFNPHISSWSPFHGAIDAVVSSLAKLTAMGADFRRAYLSFQEYFEKLGDDPIKWGKPLTSLLGALSAQKGFGVAAIGGKDSMSGSFEQLSVPPTLVSFAVAPCRADEIISPEFKATEHKVYLIPAPRDKFGVPLYREQRQNFINVNRLIVEKKIVAAMSIDAGGMAGALSKMAIGNDIGFKFDTSAWSIDALFDSRAGTLIVEAADHVDLSREENFIELGRTVIEPAIYFGRFTITLDEIKAAYTAPLEKIFPTRLKNQSVDGRTLEINPRGASSIRKHDPIVKPRILIPVFPGTNCEYDSARAWSKAGGEPEIIVVRNLTPAAVEESVNALVEGVKRSQIIMLPGGFSGGDEPDGSGKFIAAMFRNPRLSEEVMHLLKDRDGLILGICNGFQALIKLGLLPYGEIRPLATNDPTLTHNSIGRHVSCMVRTRVASNGSPWLMNSNVGDIHTVAVSHGEGRFVADEGWLNELAENGQIATQYVDDRDEPTMSLPFNPNGSVFGIEGITSPDGRVFGKMAHSERVDDDLYRNIDGNKVQPIFAAGIKYLS